MGMRIPQAVSGRWRVFKAVLWRPWKAIVLALYAAASAATFVRDNFLSPAVQREYTLLRALDALPHWSGATWVAVGLAMTLLMVLEGAYRLEQAAVATWGARVSAQGERIEALEAQRDERARRTAEMDALGVLFREGEALFARCEEGKQGPSVADAHEWANRAEDAVRKAFGNAVAAHFMNDLGVASLPWTFDFEYSDQCVFLEIRLKRLNQIIAGSAARRPEG